VSDSRGSRRRRRRSFLTLNEKFHGKSGVSANGVCAITTTELSSSPLEGDGRAIGSVAFRDGERRTARDQGRKREGNVYDKERAGRGASEIERESKGILLCDLRAGANRN